MAQDLLSAFPTAPDVLIHDFDVINDRVALIRLSTDEIRAASFLDGRIITPSTPAGWAPWPAVSAAANDLPVSAPSMIFHVGHCGSTLISRLIEAAGGPRALREPQGLRTLAAIYADMGDEIGICSKAAFAEHVSIYLRACEKISPTTIKATSMCGGLIEPVLRAGVKRALFVYVSAETYITTMLGGANTPIDLKSHAALRLRRLRTICGDKIADLSGLSLGQLAALSWACETTSIAGAPIDRGALLHVDFDRFLASPQNELSAALMHFSGAADPSRVASALAGPLMSQYSKAPEHPFSPEVRRDFLTEYARDHRAEIATGMKWLETAAESYPTIRTALDRFA